MTDLSPSPFDVPPPVSQTAAPRRGRGIFVALAVMTAGCLGFGALWITTRSDLDTVTAERDDLKAAEAARIAELNARPDVSAIIREHIADASGFDVTGDETYAEVSVTGVGLFDLSPLVGGLVELGFSESIESKIGNTRALDGTLTASGEHASASWTYHPDDGLSIVIERTD